MALTHLLLTFALTFIRPLNSNTVSSDIIQPSAKTVQKGHSVELTVQVHPDEKEFDYLEWIKVYSEDIVVSYDSETKEVEIHSSYKKRVDFDTGTYSLKLKNAQEADSGIYKARASGENNIIVGLYNVTVGTSSHGSTTGSVSLSWIIFLFLLGAIMI